MKLRALMVTGVVVACAVAVTSGSASAGCGITLELHNRDNQGVTIDWSDSDVKVGMPLATWKRLGTGTTYVGAGDTVRHNFTADLGCTYARDYRIDVNQGSSSWYANANTWQSTVHIHVD